MNNKLGEYIKSYRTEHGLSLRELAKLADISHTHIDSIEKGVDFRTGKPVRITNETIQKLAKALNQDESYLFQLSIGKEATPNNAPTLTTKDQIEIDEYLENFENELLTQTGLMFDGEPMTNESKEKLIAALRVGAEMAKKEAKEKYTPKKYRK